MQGKVNIEEAKSLNASQVQSQLSQSQPSLDKSKEALNPTQQTQSNLSKSQPPAENKGALPAADLKTGTQNPSKKEEVKQPVVSNQNP